MADNRHVSRALVSVSDERLPARTLWVGFDEESKGHRIYWPSKRSITVERSITFVPNEVDVRFGNAPVEGELEEFDELLEDAEKDNQPIPQPTELENVERESTPMHDEASELENEHVQPEIVVEEDTGGRGRRIRKASAYIRRILDGEGRATGRERDPAIPKGIQLPLAQPEEQGENASLAGNDEGANEAEWAMATVMDAAECLNPTYEEAKGRSDWPKCQQAIKVELNSLERNGTWSVVERPKDANVVDCKWVLRIKKNAAGEIEKYKARLVARGFTQIHGIDYYETYAPVARLASCRLLIAMANRNGWPLDSWSNQKGTKKGIGRRWRSWGSNEGADHGVFIKMWADGRRIILAVHVDDCLTTGLILGPASGCWASRSNAISKTEPSPFPSMP